VKLLVCAALALAVGGAVPAAADAQSVATAKPGDRIRVHRFDSRHPQIGRLVAGDNDTLVVDWLNGHREALALYQVGQVDVSGGRQRNVGRGAAYGLLVGTGLGLLFRKIATDDAPESRPPSPNLVPVSAGAGLVLGTLVGTFGAERWYPTRVPTARFGLLVPAGSRSVAIGLSGRW
jgi:hypothetical protein